MQSFSLEKSIFEYDNYRDFLRDVYTSAKQQEAKFSYRYFSRIAGFTSPNFLKLVIDGERNLAVSSIDKIAKALKLKKEEGLFFHHLVLLNQATSSEEKKIHSEQLLRSKVFKKIYPLKESEYQYYSQWYFVPIRELINLSGFREDPEWIAKQLNPPITATEAKKTLVALEKLGLVTRNSEGRLVPTEQNIETPNEVISPIIRLYHKEMLSKAGDSMDRFPREKRDISAVTIPLTESGVQRIKELLQQLRREILDMSSQEKDSTRVYQLGFQLFPLTEKIEMNLIDHSKKPDAGEAA